MKLLLLWLGYNMLVGETAEKKHSRESPVLIDLYIG